MPSNAKSRAAKRAATKRAAEAAKKARLEEAAAQKEVPKLHKMPEHYEGLPASEEAMGGYVDFENGSLQELWIRLAHFYIPHFALQQKCVVSAKGDVDNSSEDRVASRLIAD